MVDGARFGEREVTAELSRRERGFVLAAVRALGSARAERFCARRSLELGHAAGELAEPGARAAEEAELGRAVPDGLDEVHPSWYSAPPPSERPDARDYLERAAYGHLVPMGARRDDRWAQLDELGERALTELLHGLGRRRVAAAFVGAPRNGLAQLCARLGEPAASELLGEVRRLQAADLRGDEIKAAVRALGRAAVLGDEIGPQPGRALFLRVGAGWLGSALAADGDRRQRLAQKLPRSVGELLLDGTAARLGDAERQAARRLLESALGDAL